MFAVQADGKQIRTVEGLANGDKLHPLQQAFMEHHGLQCGFCTPGFLMLAVGVLEREPDISDDELLDVLSSNLCRCTGYQNIIKAVRARRPKRASMRGEKTRHADARSSSAARYRAWKTGRCLRPRPLRRRYLVSRPIAHARGALDPSRTASCMSIDAAAALALPGVHAVWTAADVADIPPIDFRLTGSTGLEPYRQPSWRSDRVRYVGEPVAVVFADDPYLAEDAAELVVLEIEELPAAVAGRRGAGRIRAGPHRPSRRIVRKGYGDVDAAFRNAHATVVELDLAIGRHSGVPLETRGAIARYDARPRRAGNARRRQGAALEPRPDRAACSAARRRRCICIEGHVGGGFGIRGELYPEDVLVCVAALRFGRPVKWIEDRREHLIAANHSRQQRHRVRAAVDARRAASSASTTSSSTIRAPICAPTPRPCPISPPPCCPGPTRAGLSRGRRISA